MSGSRKPDDLLRLERLRPLLTARAALHGAIRAFFAGRGFLEVDTPVRLPAPANEEYIDAEPSGAWYLRTSPELHMKRLLAAGYGQLFQLGPCFRVGERGRRHLPEFCMLEWYRAGAGYLDILADTRELLIAVAAALAAAGCGLRNGLAERLAGQWELLTVDDAFRRHAGAEVDALLASDTFEEVLVGQVEPELGRGAPTVLLDYPTAQGALARCKADRPERVERWELYVDGLELANAYGELTDPEEQRQRFAAAARQRHADGRQVYPPDPHFLAALDYGLPTCAGIALGVDRLLMVLTGTPELDAVVAFPPEWA